MRNAGEEMPGMNLRCRAVADDKRRCNEENRKRGNRNDLLQGVMFLLTVCRKFIGAVSE